AAGVNRLGGVAVAVVEVARQPTVGVGDAGEPPRVVIAGDGGAVAIWLDGLGRAAHVVIDTLGRAVDRVGGWAIAAVALAVDRLAEAIAERALLVPIRVHRERLLVAARVVRPRRVTDDGVADISGIGERINRLGYATEAVVEHLGDDLRNIGNREGVDASRAGVGGHEVGDAGRVGLAAGIVVDVLNR